MNKDMDRLNEQKRLKLTKFSTGSRGILVPKTFLEFVGIKDDELFYMASFQAMDAKGCDGKRYIIVSCENGQE